jgi:chemotaxis protein CheX
MLDEATLHELTETVWGTVLAMPVVRSPRASDRPEGGVVASRIQISGRWEGVIVLYLSRALAQRIAGVMFDVEPGVLDPVEIQDAVGEIANVIGGNLKALLPGPCVLSLPLVEAGEDSALDVSGGGQVAELGYLCEGEPFYVWVLERATEHPTA